MLRIDINRWFAMVAILPMVSDFNGHLYFEVRNWLVMMKLASTSGVVWGLLCLRPNTIKPSYYYSSSTSSRCDFVPPNSQRLMSRSLLNFTGRWIPISRGAFRSWNFQNGCHFKMAAIQKWPPFQNGRQYKN